MDYSRTARMIFSKFYYYTSIAATQYIVGIRYIACRLQRWAWSKANNLIFRCFQWEPIIIVVSRVPRLPTGPYRLIQTKCKMDTVQQQCSLASSKVFWSFSCPPMTFVNQNYGKIRMFWDDSNSWFEDSKSWSWFTQTLTLLASQALKIWKWNILKYCDFVMTKVGGGHEKDFCNCAKSQLW